MTRYIIQCTHPDGPPYYGLICTWGKGSTFSPPPEDWTVGNTYATERSAKSVVTKFRKNDRDGCTWEVIPVELTDYGFFKNGETPATSLPDFNIITATWGKAVKHFSKGFGGGAVYNLYTGKHIANISE